ncbi:hypothetical protein D9M71_426030 [compost metagenome]
MHGDMQCRAQRCPCPGLGRYALWQTPDIHGLQRKQGEQQPVGQLQGRGRKLRQQAATHAAHGHAEQRRNTVDQRPLLAIDVEQGGTEHGGRHAGGETLQHPGTDQPGDAIGVNEQQHRHAVEHDSRENHRFAPQVIRERTHRQQRGQQAEGIHAENQGKHGGRKLQLLLIQVIQGRWRRGGSQETEQGDCQEPQACTVRMRTGHGHTPQKLIFCFCGVCYRLALKANSLC